MIKSENILAVTSLDLKAGFFFSLSLKIKLEQNFLKFENFYWANILGISFDDAVTIGRPSARKEGPIFYGVIPSYVEPTNAAFDPSEPDEWVHVINCHVNLMGQNART